MSTTPTTVAFTINPNANTLAAGTYTADIIFTTTNGGGNVARTITLTVNPGPPRLAVSPATNIASNGIKGGPFSPSAFSYDLGTQNTSAGFTISGVPSWLTASTASGTATTTPITVTFTVNTAADALDPGTYTATITFTNTTNGLGTQTRTATLIVDPPPPQLQISPAGGIAASGIVGGPFTPGSFAYTVSAQFGTANFAITGVPSWLTASATSGTATTTAQTITFTVNAAANTLAAGSYPATITFTNTTNGLGSQPRTATLTVNLPPPQLQMSPAGNIATSGIEGGPFTPASFDYTLSASNTSVGWLITGVPSWLTASATSGTATTTPTTLSFSVNASATTLAPGTYSSTLTFTNSTNGLGTQTRTATLTVAPTPLKLQVAPAGNFAASGIEGGPFTPGSIDYVLSSSTGSIDYAITGLPSWLSASSTSGTLTTSGTTVALSVNASANALAAGSYSATIDFTNTTNGHGSQTRTASLTVDITPLKLQVTPSTNITASVVQGDVFTPTSFQYQVSSTTGSVSYSITNVPSWLTLSATSGTATTTPAMLTASINASATTLLPGTYTAPVTFTNTTNGKGNQVRMATLTVNAFQASFELLPIPSGFDSSEAWGVSSDGTTIAGKVRVSSTGLQRPFRWNNGASAVLTPLATGTGAAYQDSGAEPVNADGTVIGGYGADSAQNLRAIRWVNGSPVSMGIPGYVFGSSADGNAVSGYYFSGGPNLTAFRWANGTTTNLGVLSGDVGSSGLGISGDGLTVVGVSKDSAGKMRAFKWNGGAMSALPKLVSTNESSANAASFDGSVVVGREGVIATFPPTYRPVRWVNGVPSYLVNDGIGTAHSVSRDGQVVVGNWESYAFRWTEADGMKLLRTLLEESGITPPNFFSNNGTGISADGTTMIGYAAIFPTPSLQQAYRARFPLPTASQSLRVSSAANIALTGPQGGPFTPANSTYQLSSTTSSISWSVTGLPAWLAASPSSGTLTTSPTTVTFSPTAAANSLTPGTYTATITFTNATNGRGTQTRTAVLTVTEPPPPANDNFANAITLSTASGSTSGNNLRATSEADEPRHHTGTSGNRSVWWKWTAPAAGQATLNTAGSNFNTLLAVYDGATLATLSQIASNDDASGGTTTSAVSFHASSGSTYYIAVDGSAAGVSGTIALAWALDQNEGSFGLGASILPYARSVQVGTAATAFANIINVSGSTATGCYLQMPSGSGRPGIFQYQTTNASNQLTGSPNTPVDIPNNTTQNFVFAFTPSAAFTGTDIAITFDCANKQPVVSAIGVNTFLLSASSTPSPDLVAIGATPSGDGIVHIPGTIGAAFFATAAVNIGAAGAITASADDGSRGLPLSMTICQTNSSTGACLSPPAASVTSTLATNAVATYAVFVQGAGTVAFDPATNRLFMRLRDAGGVTRGATHVAVCTSTACPGGTAPATASVAANRANKR